MYDETHTAGVVRCGGGGGGGGWVIGVLSGTVCLRHVQVGVCYISRCRYGLLSAAL